MASKASTQHLNLKLSEIPIQLKILTVKHQRYVWGLQEGNSRAASTKKKRLIRRIITTG